MRNFIAAVIIILLVAGAAVINSARIRSVCSELDSLLAAGDYNAAPQKWEKERAYLSLFIRDGEIDAADMHMRGLALAVGRNDKDGALEHLAGARDALAEIINYETVSIGSIFCVAFRLQRVDIRAGKE